MSKPANPFFFLSVPTLIKVLAVLVALGVQTWFVAANGEIFVEPTSADVNRAVQTLASEKINRPDSKLMLCYRMSSEGQSKPIVVVQSVTDVITLSYEVKGSLVNVTAQFSVDRKAARIVLKGSEFSIRWGDLRKGHKIGGNLYYVYEAEFINDSNNGYLGVDKVLNGYCIR